MTLFTQLKYLMIRDIIVEITLKWFELRLWVCYYLRGLSNCQENK